MATRNNHSFNGRAGADLSAKEYAFGKYAAGGYVACSVLGERADVIIANTPAAAGEVVELNVGMKCKIKVGAAPVVDGAELTPAATGLAITAVATNIVRAKALEAGAAGAIIEALWVDAYIKP